MKTQNQHGIGFLPVMIVVLVIAMTGIGYNVYQTQQSTKEQAALVTAEEQIDTNASLADIQRQLADKVSASLTTGTETTQEQAKAALILKDASSSFLVQIEGEDLATRLILPAETNKDAAVKTLDSVGKTLAPYGFTHFSGVTLDTMPTDVTSINTVLNREDDYCYVSGLMTSYVEVGCASASQADIKNKAVALKPYYEAAKKDYEQTYPEETYPLNESVITLNESTRKTVDNTYELVSGGAGGVGESHGFYEVLGGGRYHFYREIAGEWLVSPSSGNGISSCEEFNTTTLQLLYGDQGCWDPKTETDTTVADYWQ